MAELVDLSALICPWCREAVEDCKEGFMHLGGTPLCGRSDGLVEAQ